MVSELIGVGTLLLSLGAAPPAAAAPTADAIPVVGWPREDRYRHFWASWGAAAMTFGGVRAVDRGAALPAALAVGATLGIAKELDDRRRGGRIDPLDLVADAVGLVAAYFFLREIR
jgi:hypothetical protein